MPGGPKNFLSMCFKWTANFFPHKMLFSYAPRVITKHWTLFLHLNLTYDPTLTRVKVDPHAKNQGPRSNGTAMRAQTDNQTNAVKYITSLLHG